MSGRRRVWSALEQGSGELPDGDELVVSKVDWLERSLRDLLDITDDIRAKGAALTVGRTSYDPADPVGAMLIQVSAWPPSSRSP